MKGLVLKIGELPKAVTIIGSNGERVRYCLMPAGRKLGAMLQKVPVVVEERGLRTVNGSA